MTAVRTSGMVFPIFLYLSCDLLFLFLRVFCIGSLLGVYALNHLNDTIPCLSAVNHSLWLEQQEAKGRIKGGAPPPAGQMQPAE